MTPTYVFHIADSTRPIGIRSQDSTATNLVAVVTEAVELGGDVLIWPKNQDDDGGRPIARVVNGKILLISTQLDTSRYISRMWGGVCYPFCRADADAYDHVDPSGSMGDVYRQCIGRFGRCEGKHYQGSGWVFGRTDRFYDPCYIGTAVRVLTLNQFTAELFARFDRGVCESCDHKRMMGVAHCLTHRPGKTS